MQPGKFLRQLHCRVARAAAEDERAERLAILSAEALLEAALEREVSNLGERG